jgi:hypothetical protein
MDYPIISKVSTNSNYHNQHLCIYIDVFYIFVAFNTAYKWTIGTWIETMLEELKTNLSSLRTLTRDL